LYIYNHKVYWRGWYISKHWASHSFIWAPLMAQHTWKCSVSCQVLVSISLLMHSVAVMIVMQFIHILHFFMIMPFTNLQKKKFRGVKSGEWEGQGMGCPLSIHQETWPWPNGKKNGQNYHTKWTSAQFNGSFNFGNTFYFIAYETGHVSLLGSK